MQFSIVIVELSFMKLALFKLDDTYVLDYFGE
jgi:hypothetical protein